MNDEALERAEERKKKRSAWLLIVATCADWLGAMLGMTAEQEIWNRSYPGEFGQNAKAQALLQSISGVISLVLNPVILGYIS